ncbi:hypothetical protein NliqN6_4703 [Naganishia liquefaciens]|uniref:Dolichyl-diphosphooligosaccharide-protein glycosyltransferase subunit OST5 n=1 Tax=Naganishia liquefaciens TaxID=104408 RepID=A0A8H3YI76_9TREE|nr:hypothetical protein NliqN6_4703 [Naganishia liquefaciens]
MSTYTELKNLFESSPAFQPPLPVSLLPVIATVSLSAAFALTFMFTTTSKPSGELLTSLAASALTSIGVVAVFCTVGVYV